MRSTRKVNRLSPILLALLLLPTSAAGALEITGTLRLENLGFAIDRSSTDSTVPGGDLFWNGSLSFVQDISDAVAFEAGFTRDLVLRNVAYTEARYATDFLSVGLGAFVGVFNTTATPLKTGISTTMKLELPGTVSLSVHSQSSLSNDPDTAGDYAMERTEITFGFSVASALCSVGLDSARFTSLDGGVQTIDGLTGYSFAVVVYEKNVPFRVHFHFSWQDLKKTFRDGSANPPSVGLGSLVAGLGIDLDLSASFAMYVGGSANIYSIGSGSLAGVSVLGFAPVLFRTEAGFTLKTGPAPAS